MKMCFTDSEINLKPVVLLLGPWGTGKTTAIKYLLGESNRDWPQGVAGESILPSTAETFTIYQWGETESIEGSPELASDWSFASLQKFGLKALERIRGVRLNNKLLQKVGKLFLFFV